MRLVKIDAAVKWVQRSNGHTATRVAVELLPAGYSNHSLPTHSLRGDGVPPRSSACVAARGEEALPCRIVPSVMLAAQAGQG